MDGRSEDEEEFRLSLRRRVTASPDGGGSAWGLLDVDKLVRMGIAVFRGKLVLDPRAGRMNLSIPPSAIGLGGEREGMPLLLGREPVIESRWWFLVSVGTKPRSREMKREERRDSSSSS